MTKNDGDMNLELAITGGDPGSLDAGDDGSTLAEQQERVLAAIAGAKLDTVQERVAWILNHHPEARDSDITLQLRYWEAFQPELFDGVSIDPQELYHLARLTSLSRARAKIQNSYQLFRASPEIRAHRGTLSESERATAAAQRPTAPLYQVAADESGKTGKHLIWGSVWVLHAPEVLSIERKVGAWKDATGFNGELHFKDIEKGSLGRYMAFATFLHEELTSAVTFRAISVERSGLKVDALETLLYHLLVRGVEHEHASGRAPLPRRLQLWKDLEEPGRDKVMLAELRDRIEQAGVNRFEGQLTAAEFHPLYSESSALLQLADLNAGSLNRVLNAPGSHPKDGFAHRLLEVLGTPRGPQDLEHVEGMAVHIAL